MTTFQVNVSRNFKGGEPFSDIDVADKKELITALRNVWKRTGITNDTGECFLIAKFAYEGEPLKLMVGNFVFYSDGEFNGRSDSGFDESDDEKWESIGYEDKSNFIDEEERFDAKIKHLFKINKVK